MCRRYLLLICVPTLAILLVTYYASDEVPLPRDIDSVATSTAINVTNIRGARATPTLQLVVVISRHGKRGPYTTFPTSPYRAENTTIWPYGPRELTSRGRMQMYKLGLKIRSLYNGFLDELYYSEDFVAKSTAFERTIQSAQLFLAGLFPPRGFQVWNKTLLWQPIPVFHSSVDYQEMANVSQTKWCPKFRVAKEKAIAEFQQEYRSDIIEFFKLVNPYTRMDQLETLNTTVSISLAIFVMWESFYTMVEEGLPLPSWADKFYPQPLTFLAEKLLRVAAIGSDTQIRYLEGLFFKELVDLMRSKVEGTLTPDRKMFYYCGHDFTLLGFQGILGLADGQSGLLSTRTGSALIFELHKHLQTDLFYVQVLHIDGTSSDMEPSHVEIPGCNSPCDLRRLLNLTEKYYNITDWKKECQIIED